jgi:hypothetical protein
MGGVKDVNVSNVPSPPRTIQITVLCPCSKSLPVIRCFLMDYFSPFLDMLD